MSSVRAHDDGLEQVFPVERAGDAMTSSSVLIVDMAILVGIFLLGLLAKMFPRKKSTSERVKQ